MYKEQMLNPGTKLYANTHVVKEVANPKQNPITTSIVLTFFENIPIKQIANVGAEYRPKIL